MQKNKELHAFLLNKAEQLTEEWYDSLDKSDPSGVYASADPEVIKSVKSKNFEFHQNLSRMLVEEESIFYQKFSKWILEVATDDEHVTTPVHFVIREFMRVRKQYLDFIEEFVSLYNERFSQEEIGLWNEMIIKAFDSVILWYIEERNNYVNNRLASQKEMINELSSPVIVLNNDAALLPLIGDIDTARAKLILENTLEQCADKRIRYLFIDLSGVVVIDTMVAHQIFQLVDALKLLGVATTLSGMRPEIAQTAVQLGLSFDKVSIKSNLSQAISLKL
ncbi:STAS domain-containing protein [Peribacillus cavernae]|uniref:STAS domain-containing protein n=1 Tax=Peribacillus cavernae TaxID=1674310 RepID=A0A3S0UBF1_9BACI|nr:STAS domain-containing protein [Peribacillus cavernae]MDQ0221103.1 rsbT co-antagonist protein RsbR [Peribacillus cavernae]RUQ27605.1 STAS domain-containing protein [Peribacillus cavernae]